ncbi:B-cell receptor CD22-like [Triplophysa dalaica]|uniref:B-cell receptor CD22-like n=1 Tax=Triplophysa dalaica TaxID=1582913 RepID=UPI0024E01772|nr:B-cell receptor CD22-like [Triplophysa dalaica]
MSVRMAPPLPLILLLMFPGSCGGDGGWAVTYISSHICALEGSSLIVPCTYTYPPGHQVKNVFWTKTTMGTGGEPPNLFNDPEYRQRIQYLGDEEHNCTIRLTHVKQTDSRTYFFRFTTNITNGKWIGRPGLTFNVTDLQVETSKKVKEGDSVTLTCKTTCRLTEATTFIWLKNMKSLRKRTDVNNDKLVLRSVRREDAGIYSCSVRGHNLISPEYRLNVMYPPEKTLAVVSPSGVIVEGDSVNLTCSSDANPPVHTHTWFKEKSSIGSGNIYRIRSIRSDHSGEYKCKVFNDYGMRNSNALILNVMYPPRDVSVSINSSGVIVEGDSVNLTCSSESNPPVHNYSWFKENQTSSVGSGHIFRPLESGWFYCLAQNKHGSQRSAAVPVIFDGGQNVLLYTFAGGTSGLGVLFFIFIILVICKKSQRSDNIRKEQENDLTYQDMSKTDDDHSENIYSNFIPSCSINENVCESPADVDYNYEIYENLDPVHTSSEDDVYCTPDVIYDDPSDDIYTNPNMWRSLESNIFCVAVVMSVRMAPPLPLILLLMFPEVSGGGDWVVTYISTHICALEGSSVIIPCTYTYPPGHQVKDVFWNKTKGRKPPNLFNDPEYRQRIQYLGDKHHNCTIRLTDVKKADSHKYYFGFTTNITGGKYTGTPEITLNVTDLQVETSKKVKEGDSVTLTCKTTCRLTEETTFIWYRNMKSLRKRTDVNNDKLVLWSVRREDAGIYSCSVRGHNLISPEYRLNVMYPPEKTLPVVSPSGVIVEGDSVNLTCSSDANPPVHTHTWFKEKSSIGSGNIYRILNIRSDHSGEYKCKSTNKHGVKYSEALTLNVMYAPRNVSVSISSSGVIVEGDSVNLTCSSESNPPVHIYSWFKENQTSSVGSGQTFSITNTNSSLSGWFYCVAQNKHGSQRSAAVLVIFDGGQNVLLYIFAGVISGLGGLFFIFIVLFVCKMKKQRSNNNGGEQENDSTYQDMSKRHDDHRENIYTKCISVSICESPPDVDCNNDIYQNLDPEDKSHEDVYVTPDVLSDQCRAADGVYTTLELQSRSSEYEN